jgi:hypothetical protein
MTKSVLKKMKGAPKGPVINQRYKWVEFEADDGSVYKSKVRTSLINLEVEALIAANAENDHKTLCEVVAPYVEEWNIQVGIREDDGTIEYYTVDPPAIGGVLSFDYAPRNLAMAIVGTLINEPFKKIDPKSETPVETTDEP